jgi:uncharacterized lipoprotein NlpE involved in copper resistance
MWIISFVIIIYLWAGWKGDREAEKIVKARKEAEDYRNKVLAEEKSNNVSPAKSKGTTLPILDSKGNPIRR